jgi:hypothetical protein
MLPVANTAGMIEHLRLISQATAKDRQALVIVDRAGLDFANHPYLCKGLY